MTDTQQGGTGPDTDSQERDSRRMWIIAASVAGAALLIVLLIWLIAWISNTNEYVAELENRTAELESVAESVTAEETSTPEMEPTPSDEMDDSSPDSEDPGSDDEPPTGISGRELVIIDDTEWLEEPMLTVDYLQFLTGQAAADAAAAAGEESPPPNDYFILNANPQLRTFPVDRTIQVTLVTTADGFADPDGYEVPFGLFYDGLQGMSGEVPGMWETPYWITIEDGTITAIEAQYLP